MKKLFIGLFALVLIIVAVGIFSLNSIVKGGIETVGPNITRTSVTLDSANISIFSGSGSLENLVVGTPQGFKSDYTLSLANVSLKVDPSSLMSDTIVIEEILVDAPDIIYEITPKGTNIKSLMNNVDLSKRQKSMQESSGNENKGQHSNKKVIIENLKIKNGKVTMAASLIGKGAQSSVALPDIQLSDIGKESGGTSFESAIAKIMNAVTKKVATINPAQFPTSSEGIKDAVEEVGDSIKGLFQ